MTIRRDLLAGAGALAAAVPARVDALPQTQRDAIRSGNAERLFDLG